jgi:hypothetical protein
MSTHAETIQYLAQAAAACETTLTHGRGATSELDTVENCLRATYDNTEQLGPLAQCYEQAAPALLQLAAELAAALARFQS